MFIALSISIGSGRILRVVRHVASPGKQTQKRQRLFSTMSELQAEQHLVEALVDEPEAD